MLLFYHVYFDIAFSDGDSVLFAVGADGEAVIWGMVILRPI